MPVVLDSWAVMALLDDEPAAARVDAALEADETVMSWINLGEVYYQLLRRRGEALARTAVDAIRARVRVELPDEHVVLSAARVKAAGGLSSADAFCVATAQRHRAQLWTGDEEILRLDAGVELVNLREAR
jgi:predicted nucleic acid-binding protein